MQQSCSLPDRFRDFRLSYRDAICLRVGPYNRWLQGRKAVDAGKLCHPRRSMCFVEWPSNSLFQVSPGARSARSDFRRAAGNPMRSQHLIVHEHPWQPLFKLKHF